MKIFQALNLVDAGKEFCEEKLLPFLIAYAEPRKDPKIQPPLFKKNKKPYIPNAYTAVHSSEIVSAIENYRTIIFFLINIDLVISACVGYLISLIIEGVSFILVIPNSIELLLMSVVIIGINLITLGIYAPIAKRAKIWKNAQHRQLLENRIVHYAQQANNKVIAEILYELEKAKKEHQEEVERVNEIKKERSLLDLEVMEKFNQIAEKNKERDRTKNLITSFLLWFSGVISAYFIELTLNHYLIGTKINLPSSNN